MAVSAQRRCSAAEIESPQTSGTAQIDLVSSELVAAQWASACYRYYVTVCRQEGDAYSPIASGGCLTRSSTLYAEDPKFASSVAGLPRTDHAQQRHGAQRSLSSV